MVLFYPYLVIDVALAILERKEKILHCKPQNRKPHTGPPHSHASLGIEWLGWLQGVTEDVEPCRFPIKKFLLDLLHSSNSPTGTKLSKHKPLLVSYKSVAN